MEEEAVNVAAYRLRQWFWKALREEIAETVAQKEETEEEFQYLREVLPRG